MLVDPFSYLYNIGIHCRTGFEENKDFPIVLNSVVAGRYYITEYLGSAAFSKVVQAHDLQTGMDVCLKIIKNDKDFFDQSLDEIKLLKFVNKYDPLDEHHVLRLYDYFYHQVYASYMYSGRFWWDFSTLMTLHAADSEQILTGTPFYCH